VDQRVSRRKSAKSIEISIRTAITISARETPREAAHFSASSISESGISSHLHMALTVETETRRLVCHVFIPEET
jgi:hypothetical protein